MESYPATEFLIEAVAVATVSFLIDYSTDSICTADGGLMTVNIFFLFYTYKTFILTTV
jgi:hypothetical protein